MTRGGLPHSDIFGSKLVCSSPKLFAACHVLHRLLAPRHSPYTLSSLTIRNSKLTRTNRLHVDWSATVPCNTACHAAARKGVGGLMLWSEKTTVCRIFSCQRSACRNLPAICLRRVGLARHAATSGSQAALTNQRPTSVCARLKKPHSLTETFSAFALWATARQARTCAVVSKIFQPSSGWPTVHLRSSSYGGQPSPELACQPKLAVSQRAKVGGEYRARTGDLLVANQALSQLS